ncbi:hypothetical protein GOP47_0004084 [Adiantum capillus-veneris]|uniref:Protein CMSS1 n=1 Tax=Adiantum capillus-veneris TaxID=13818 RepID=A0A9D4V7Z6_ADICA|nr:hypothetical protein GOP47_0004084 [Adiantum capillus-veneris]
MVSKQKHSSASKKRTAIIKTQKKTKRKRKISVSETESNGVQWQTPAFQANWLNGFLGSAPGSSPSQLECLRSLSEESFVDLQAEGQEREPNNLTKHVKSIFKETWEDSLCKVDKNKENGNPALLVVCSSATRCVDLLKGLRSLTKACKPAKLFAKHIKVEEQVKALQDYVNIAVGTPNRVKKLIDIGALGLGSLEVVLLDMHEDAKGFTIFTVPQVKNDLLELCKSHLHQHALAGRIKFCLY